MRRLIICFLTWIGLVVVASSGSAWGAPPVRFESDVQPILLKYCAGCHNDSDREGDFSLRDYVALMRGTPQYPVVIAGNSKQSKLVLRLHAQGDEKMPPKNEPQLTEAQIELLQRWIDEGASGSSSPLTLHQRLTVPKITRKATGLSPVSALSMIPDRELLAVGRSDSIEFRKGASYNEVVSTIDGVEGKIGQLRLSHDRKRLVCASGISGVGGQVTLIDLATFKILRQFESNTDLLFAIAINPQGSLIATSGYDRIIYLYETETGKLVRTFEGHHGAVYDLDFDKGGTVLASASADETVKIWNVETGERLDTLGQGEGEMYSVRFSPDGQRIAACGADRRLRLWQFLSKSEPMINPMIHSAFAHEGAVLALAYSPDSTKILTAGEDKKLKAWSSLDLRPLSELVTLPDTPTSIGIDPIRSQMAIGSIDGRITSLAIGGLESISLPSPSKKSLQQRLEKDRIAIETVVHDEQEPNSNAKDAQQLALPAEVSGVVKALPQEDGIKAFGLQSIPTGEEDWFSFPSKQGETWIVEVDAARSKSPLDSHLEICDEQGKPVLQTRLQAVRESYLTFRGKNSEAVDDFRLHRWEDMELNEYLYVGGEVVKLWLYPRGPDSGFKVFPGFGQRYTYFNTTPSAHALGATAWIVRELTNDEKAIPNGLPLFPIYFENDDDPRRQFGKDSKLTFTAPRDGEFRVRLRDSRGLGGDLYAYRLRIRPPQPDFSLRAEPATLAIAPGSGREIEFTAERMDGFEGPIEIELNGLPPNWIATQPLTIEAEQHKAVGTIYCPLGAELTNEDFSMQVMGRAQIGTRHVEHSIAKPLTVKRANGDRIAIHVLPKGKQVEASTSVPLVIHPGETIAAKIVVDRGKFQGDISFGKEESGRNLPHGIIVGNIGLSGLLIPAGQTQQDLFLVASPWIEPQERLIHLQSNSEGKPTTVPILLRVER